MKELQDKIRKLLPELKVSDKHYKSIGLAEVLRCLLLCKTISSFSIDVDGEILEDLKYTNIFYNLKTPLLKDQSEEVINFLNERI